MLPDPVTDYYEKAPKEYDANLRFRKDLVAACEASEEARKRAMEACRRDILFWINAFCWLYEPRPRKSDDGKRLPRTIPFITRPRQNEAILTIVEHLGYRDIGIEKARGEGATWMIVVIFLYYWLFDPEQLAFGLVSRNMQAADNPDDPDSLLWKVIWQIKMLPWWMRPTGFRMAKHRSISKHSVTNPVTGSSIVAYAAVGDLISGGRKTAFAMDEFAKFPRGPDEEAMSSTGPATDCRIIISTPKGADGAYYRAMTEDSNMVKIVLDWKDNPYRMKGAYRVRPRSIIPVNPESPPPDGYSEKFFKEIIHRLRNRGFTVKPGQIRSPWYDNECLRPGATPVVIAQEYDRSFGGSTYRFFDGAVIDRLIRTGCRPPSARGELAFDRDTYQARFVPSLRGLLLLWIDFDLSRRPPLARYVVGADIASGVSGERSSNSVLSVLDIDTGRKVAEMAAPAMSPSELADYGIAMCNFFRSQNGPAILIWEDNGPGVQFRTRVVDVGFRNLWRRPVDETSGKRTQKLGWWSDRRNKPILLGQYATDLADGKFLNPHDEALRECLHYVTGPDGRVDHVSAGAQGPDKSGAGQAHGDRVTADALCDWVRHEMVGGRTINPTMPSAADGPVSPNCFLGRRMAAMRKRSRRRRLAIVG